MGDETPGAVRFLTDFSAGSRIAGYCLEEQIGHGGTAVVFRAQDERALTDQQRKLGLDQADALASRASLAAARQEASRSDEAEKVGRAR